MNKRYFAYIRVSTPRQGERGVSLPEQKEAIERYAAVKVLPISRWFEGRETASKVGRPVFNEMLALLKKGEATGVIIHKIDRSARNLKDWAEIGQLVEAGIEVHFATESLDLTSPGGMLSADVQAVISAYYSRNLREEVKKGFYGRLKQGYYPMPAPLGYLDQGAAKPKAIDPVRAPLMKKAFELYSSGKYSQVALREEMHRLGLRSKSGRKIQKNFLHRALKNPFYMGLIHIEKTNQTFLGSHQTIVSKNLFEQVQRAFSGKFTAPKVKHDFLFRQLFWCKLCGRSLIAETQKGHVYYRCQRKDCPTKSIREEGLDQGVLSKLIGLDIEPNDYEYLRHRLNKLKQNFDQDRSKEIESVEIQLAQIKDRLSRLTDAYLDNALDRETFEQKKTALLMERRAIEDRIKDLRNGSPELPKRLDHLLELLKSPYSQYISGSPTEKRDLVQETFSNRALREKTLEISLAVPFTEVAVCVENTSGGASCEIHRRTFAIIDRMLRAISINGELGHDELVPPQPPEHS